MRRCSQVLLASLILVSLPAPARAAVLGSFSVGCAYSHTLPDDPIVFPGQPGASHPHDFFGNKTTNAGSDLDSMLAGSTTCGLRDDAAGYWSPAGFLGVTQITPKRLGAYYFNPTSGSVEAFPAGLQMIAGNKAATSPAENGKVSWFCGLNSTPIATHPYDCSPYRGLGTMMDGVVGRIDFPSCWDGTGLKPADVSYPTSGRCPAGYSHRLPLLSYRVHFRIMDPCAGATPCGPFDPDTNVKLALSSGAYYTLHADFWNSWHQAKLDQLVADCLNAHVKCGKQKTPNQPPVASFTSSCSALTCTFIDASTDPDGSLGSWSWSFGDGVGTATLQNPTYVYAVPGTYTVTLRVIDNLGATATASQAVTVSA